jgi:hypothetical protein
MRWAASVFPPKHPPKHFGEFPAKTKLAFPAKSFDASTWQPWLTNRSTKTMAAASTGPMRDESHGDILLKVKISIYRSWAHTG